LNRFEEYHTKTSKNKNQSLAKLMSLLSESIR